ncbi:MAG: hypothetical protein A2189_09150 [Paenibacillus sp. RIFOXYA1_FULL_44_5]|nr:MAG: hypothetical protein A2189_09150 [Paenibacillus sp. RIFOXYA1_FULL_44_5]
MKKGSNKYLRSFRYAFEGIKYALYTQHNMRFHFFAAFMVFILALLVRVTGTQLILLFFAITVVIVSELLNTAIEKTVDLAMPEHHINAKIAKDVAAAAVLVSAVFAVFVGIFVFYSAVMRSWQTFFEPSWYQSPLTIVLAAIIVIIIIGFVINVWRRKQR